jgi:acetyl-CoA acetyltransferase family protein
MSEAVIIDGVRTPFARGGTALKDLPAEELGRIAVGELLQKTSLDPKAVDEVIIGTVSQMVDTANLSRVIALMAGLPKQVSAYTVNRNCASSLEAIGSAVEKIRAGMADTVVAGGVESMSNVPVFLFSKRFSELMIEASKAKTLRKRLSAFLKLRPRDLKPFILSQTDPLVDMKMGDTAEVLAKEFGISREEQDRFAQMSHLRAAEAKERLREEIAPVYLPSNGGTAVRDDVGPRPNQRLEDLSRLPPVFDKKNGTVTAGNASPITDGASALLMMNQDKARSLGYKPLGRIIAYAYAGLEPERMGLGPAFSTARLLKRTGMKLSDFGLIEINEAFAAQVIANERAFTSKRFAQEQLDRAEPLGEIRREILNVNGGAIAIGHPLGASGGRLMLTLLYEMRRRSQSLGLVTLCVGGGQGAAFAVERMS